MSDPPQAASSTDSRDNLPMSQSHSSTLDNTFPYWIASIAVALVVLNGGLLSYIAIILGTAALSSLPQARYVIDGFCGVAETPQERLSYTFPTLPLQPPTRRTATLPQMQATDLTSIPEPLQTSLVTLVDLIVRDFVSNWYLLPSVSTGDPLFLDHMQHLLSSMISTAFAKASSKNGREVSVFLVGCISMTIVRELNEAAQVRKQNQSRSEEIEARVMEEATRMRQTRAVAEELVLTLAPTTATSSPLIRCLLNEILAVQLNTVIATLDEDWFNRTIVDSLRPASTPKEGKLSEAVNAVETAVAEAAEDTAKMSRSPNIKPQSASPMSRPASSILPRSTPHLQVADTGSAPITPPRLVSPTPILSSLPVSPAHDQTRPTSYSLDTVDGILGAYLEGSVQDRKEVVKSIASIAPYHCRHQFSHVPKLLSPSSTLDSSSLAEQLSIFLESRHQAEAFSRLYTQLVSFQRVESISAPTTDMLRHDARTALMRVRETLNSHSTQNDEGVRSAVAGVIRSIERAPSPTVFSSLESWLIDQLEDGEVGQWIQHHEQSNFVVGMSMPNLFSRTHDDSGSGPPPASSSTDYSLAGLSFGRPVDEDDGSTPVNRYRSSSFTRTAASPPESDWGSPLRQAQRRVSDQFAMSPEEGDLTEGYSLDDEGVIDPFKSPFIPPLTCASSSSLSQPEATAFSVSVTDISPPSAWDSKGMVRTKKELEFMIAVEAQGVPGFIVTRKWSEVERMDVDVHNKTVSNSGTVDFPRALLPSLPYKDSTIICRGLEAYFANLLREPRYSSTQPVLTFFARERPQQAGFGIFDLGKGVTNLSQVVGKEVNKGLAMPANLAHQGFNSISKGLAGLPFGSKRRSTISNEVTTSSRSNSVTSTSPTLNCVPLPTRSPSPLMESSSSTRSSTMPPPMNVSNSSIVQPVNDERDGTIPSSEVDVPPLLQESVASNVTASIAAGANFVLAAADAVVGALDPTPATGPVELIDKFESSKQGDTLVHEPHARRSVEVSEPTAPPPPPPPPPPLPLMKLSQVDFDAILVSVMSVLEAAYGLQTSTKQWSMKRGVLRMLETMVRTSYGSVMKSFIASLMDQLTSEKVLSQHVDELTNSFWPNQTWWSCQPQQQEVVKEVASEWKERSLEEKLETKEEAKQLFVSSWDPIKIALGPSATSQAASQLFNVLQGQGATRLAHAIVLDVIRILILL